MTADVGDIIQIAGSLWGLILIPIWRSINELRKGQEKTNVILARDYVAKSECRHSHENLRSEMNRVHERLDEIIV